MILRELAVPSDRTDDDSLAEAPTRPADALIREDNIMCIKQISTEQKAQRKQYKETRTYYHGTARLEMRRHRNV